MSDCLLSYKFDRGNLASLPVRRVRALRFNSCKFEVGVEAELEAELEAATHRAGNANERKSSFGRKEASKR